MTGERVTTSVKINGTDSWSIFNLRQNKISLSNESKNNLIMRRKNETGGLDYLMSLPQAQ